MIDKILMAARIATQTDADPTTLDARRAAFRALVRLVDDYFSAGRSDAHCRACRAPIIWTKTAAGKNAPLDAVPITGMDADGEMRRVYLSHFATCPAAAEFGDDDTQP